MTLKIRELSKAEVENLAKIMAEIIDGLQYYNEVAREHEIAKYSASGLTLKIEDDPQSVLIAEEDGEMVGFCLSRFDDMLLWIEWFGVIPGKRNKGTAKALVKALELSAPSRNAHKIWCDCRTANTKSANLLTSCGYTPLCTVKNHWYGQDFILWQKEILINSLHEVK